MQLNEFAEESLTPKASPSEDGAVDALCDQLLPIWSGQIEAAKEITNSSIEQLSQRFYSLSQRVQKTVTESANEHDSTKIVALLNESQTQLGLVSQLFKSSIKEKQVLMDAIAKLLTHTKEMHGMADMVTRIAKETNMVAVNAAIEAAHVGEKGRGFAVVAEAIRRLSNEAAKIGAQISEKFKGVTQDISDTNQLSTEFDIKDKKLLTETEGIVHNVLNQFSITVNQIMSNSELLESESKRTGEEISEVLVFLQFQDRVSQMLSHVTQDIHKLHEALQSGETPLDKDAWLAALKATYTMEEQHAIHQGKPFKSQFTSKAVLNQSSRSSASSSDEITFF